VIEADVAPLPHKKATGDTPPEELAVQVMLDAEATPLHDTDNASACAIPANAKMPVISADAAAIRNFMFRYYLSIAKKDVRRKLHTVLIIDEDTSVRLQRRLYAVEKRRSQEQTEGNGRPGPHKWRFYRAGALEQQGNLHADDEG